jgi:hypothetical protein
MIVFVRLWRRLRGSRLSKFVMPGPRGFQMAPYCSRCLWHDRPGCYTET